MRSVLTNDLHSFNWYLLYLIAFCIWPEEHFIWILIHCYIVCSFFFAWVLTWIMYLLLFIKSLTVQSILLHSVHISCLTQEKLSPHSKIIKIFFHILRYSMKHSIKLKKLKFILAFIDKEMKKNCLHTFSIY